MPVTVAPIVEQPIRLRPHPSVRRHWSDEGGDQDCVRWIQAIQPGAVVLEVAGGRWAKVQEMQDRGARHVCLDVIPTDTRGPTFVLGDVMRLPFRDGSFTHVLALALLEHVREPWVALEEMCRVLLPGGRCLWHACFWQGIHRDPNDFYRFTDEGAAHLTRRAGMRVDRIVPVIQMLDPGENEIRPSYFIVEATRP